MNDHQGKLSRERAVVKENGLDECIFKREE